jgi:AcrR family transcriptional regulator
LNVVQEKSERRSKKVIRRGLMGSKTAIRRERQRQALIEAAEAAIARGGLSNLKAREIANEAGCALGAIYNLVEDMDEVVLRVGSRTLARLGSALGEAAAGRPLNSIADAVERLVSIASAYCRFAAANRNLWRTLFEHQMADAKPPPVWFIEEQMRLFEHASAPLRLLMKEASNSEVLMMSRTLFAAVHGIVLFGVEQKMISVPPASLELSIEKFVRLSCAGLVHGSSSLKAQVVQGDLPRAPPE